MKNNTGKLKLTEKLGYGFGDLASVLYWQTFMLYFTYFYTDVFLLPAGIAATMFLVSRIFDGVNDPMMGIIADRTNTKWGKFRPYLLWLAVPFAVAGVLVFTVPDFGMSGKIIWAYSTFILIMVLYTAINIPYTSLLGVISPDSNERTSVSSIKFLFAFGAGIIISATLLPMAKTLGKGDESIITAKVENNSLIINEVRKGNAQVEIFATDASGNTEKTGFSFKVNPTENNTPDIDNPIHELNLVSGFEKEEINIDNFFKPSAAEPFIFEAKSLNDDIVEVTLENNLLTIKEKALGNAKIQVTAKDRKWGDKTHSFYANVVDTTNANPVVLDSTTTYSLTPGFEKKEIDLSTIISDPDGDQLSFRVESSNKNVITPFVEGYKLTFLEANKGIAKLNIEARDNKGGLLFHTIEFLVASESNNRPFVKNTIVNITETEGYGNYAINLSDIFTDIDGEQLTYDIKVINSAKGWQRSFMIFGIAAVLFFLIAFKSTKERVNAPKSQVTSVGKDLSNLISNKPWLILLATTITFILFVAVRGSVTVHYFKYVVGEQSLKLPFLGNKMYDFVALASAYNTIGQISSFIGVLIVAWFAKVAGKKRAFVVFFIIAIFSTGIIYFLRAEQLGLIFFFQITGSLTGGPLSVLIWAMYADTADYQEWKNGTRSTGLIFSASTMSQKFGWAFGAFVALNLMAQLGFQPNETQSAESIRGLLLLFSLIPAGMGVLSALILMAYPLNDKRVQEIEGELIQRRKESGDDAVND